jgi:hypothetical protein
MAAIYRFIAGWSIPSAVWLIRVTTAGISSAVIPIAYFTARRVFQDDRLALGTPVVIACMPELFFFVCRVSNEGLAVAFGSLLIYWSVRILEEPPSTKQGAAFGVILGAALLTKAYFLALVPFGLLILLGAYRKRPGQAGGALRQALAAITIAAAISVWWYARNVMASATLTGHVEDIAAASQAISLLEAARQVNWFRIFDFMGTSHIWLGGWSFLVVRAWMYHLTEAIIIVAFAGIGLRTCFGPGSAREKGIWLWMCVALISFLAALCYNAIQAFRALGRDLTVGYYLYALVVPEVVLLVAGLGYWIRTNAIRIAVAGLATLFLGIDVFGTWFVSLPYYAGLVRHAASGRLPVLHVGQLAGGGLSILLRRLAFAGPPWMSAECMAMLITGYFVTAGALLWISYRTLASPRIE